MMSEFSPEPDERFDEILSRLDALVKRGNPIPDAPPPLDAGIPVLTELYQPEMQGDASSVFPVRENVNPSMEVILEAIIPSLLDTLEKALSQNLKPALEAAINEKLEELRPQLKAMLVQQLSPDRDK